jgi:hypothetical protein
VEELVELDAVLVGNTECRVTRAHELTGGVHEPVEHGVETELAGDCEHDVAHGRERVVARSLCHAHTLRP